MTDSRISGESSVKDWSAFDPLFDRIKERFSCSDDFITAFLDYTFRKNIQQSNFSVSTLDARKEYINFLNIKFDIWWSQRDKRNNKKVFIDLSIDNDVEMDVDKVLKCIENNDNHVRVHDDDLVIDNIIQVINPNSSDILVKYFNKKNIGLINTLKPVPDNNEDDVINIKMPEMTNSDILKIKEHNSEEILNGANYGCYWWAQSDEKIFLHVNLSTLISYQTSKIRIKVTKIGFKIKLLINDQWKIFMANKFYKGIKEYNLQADNQIMIIVANKMKNEYWSKCLITDSECIEFKLHDLPNHLNSSTNNA